MEDKKNKEGKEKIVRKSKGQRKNIRRIKQAARKEAIPVNPSK